MGDMADELFEQGMDEWLRHQGGDCGPDPCPYCEREINEPAILPGTDWHDDE